MGRGQGVWGAEGGEDMYVSNLYQILLHFIVYNLICFWFLFVGIHIPLCVCVCVCIYMFICTLMYGKCACVCVCVLAAPL